MKEFFKKNKKPIYIALFALDCALTIGLLIISIIMLAMSNSINAAELAKIEPSNFIEFFIKNPNVYLFTCVIPLFLLLAGNIIVLVMYVKKTTKHAPVKVDSLTDEQRELLKAELLKDLQEKSKE